MSVSIIKVVSHLVRWTYSYMTIPVELAMKFDLQATPI